MIIVFALYKWSDFNCLLNVDSQHRTCKRLFVDNFNIMYALEEGVYLFSYFPFEVGPQFDDCSFNIDFLDFP